MGAALIALWLIGLLTGQHEQICLLSLASTSPYDIVLKHGLVAPGDTEARLDQLLERSSKEFRQLKHEFVAWNMEHPWH